MKKHLKYFLFSAVTLSLLACGGMANIKSSEKNSSYENQITSLLVIIDTSHLAKAFVGDSTQLTPTQKNVVVPASEATPRSIFSNPKDRLQHLDNAINGIREAFASGLGAGNVDVATDAINVAADKSAVVKSIVKNKRKQFLILSTDSFQTTQKTYAGAPYGNASWNGKVSWSLTLYDLDKTANPEGKVVWKAKTDLFSLGIPDCGMDAYKICSTRFANAVIDQMRGEGLIAKK